MEGVPSLEVSTIVRVAQGNELVSRYVKCSLKGGAAILEAKTVVFMNGHAGPCFSASLW